jgi:hypothetical protein
MKKLIGIFSLIMLFATAGNAQDVKGNYSIDFNLDPAALFDAAAGPIITMPYIKARYFIAADMAVRLGLGLQFGSDKNYTDPDPDVNDYEKESYFGITFAPGIEKHFGSNKFFAYVGAELPITSYSEKYKEEIDGTSYTTKNPYGNAYLGVGLNFIGGFDYYVFNNFYIGAELAPGFAYKSYKDTENADGEVVDKGGKETSFSLSASSGVRIGVRF